MRRHVRLPLSVLLLTSVFFLPAARADSRSDAQFLAATNSARSSHGLGHYAVAGDLTAVARRWAAHMAAHRQLAHNPSFTSEVCCWAQLGENVGAGGSVSAIQRAFMASASHRANILSGSFTQVGIGTARGSDGKLYVDELFRRPTHAAPRTAPHAAARTGSQSGSPHRSASVSSAPTSRGLPRASRGALRRTRLQAPPAQPHSLLLTELAAAGRAAQGGYVDPVGGAVAYVRVVSALRSSRG